MSNVTLSRTGRQAGRDEKAILNDIAAELTRLEQNHYNIGRLVEEFVRLKGGIQYGDNTIEKISRQLGVESRQLRRYWDYYRLHAKYGNDLKQFGKSLTASHYYALARYLNVSQLTPARQKARIIQFAKQKKAKDDSDIRMTVEEFEAQISNDIDSLKKGHAENPVAPKAKPSQSTGEPKSTPINAINATPVEIISGNNPLNETNSTPADLFKKAETAEDEWCELIARLSEMGQDISPNLESMQRRIDSCRESISDKNKRQCA